MIQESKVDVALNRLSEYFGPRLVIRPPASAAELAELESLLGPLPRELAIFLLTCNGVRVEGPHAEPLEHLWHLHEMLAVLVSNADPAIPDGLLPLRGDATGERDWLVLSPDALHGAVVRWDPLFGGGEPIASTFGRYLDAWSRYLTETLQPNGARRTDKIGVPFDASFVAPLDTDLHAFREDPSLRRRLDERRQPVPCGDDYE